MLISIRLPALLEVVEGFCQPQVIQGGDSQVMNSYLIPGLRSNTRQVRSSYEHASKNWKDIIWKGLGEGRVWDGEGAGSQGKRSTTLWDC